jgi:predicted GH43/DUF377 family glycosyl hydrolase
MVNTEDMFSTYFEYYEKDLNSHISNYKNLRDDKILIQNHPYYNLINNVDSIYKMGDSIYVENDNLIKKLEINYYPYIHPTNYLNGSLVRYKHEILFFYRTENRNKKGNFFYESSIVVCQLNENLQPMGNNKIILLEHNTKNWNIEMIKKEKGDLSFPTGLFLEDPRVIVHRDNINIIYTDGYKMYRSILDDNFEVIKTFNYFNEYNNDILKNFKVDSNNREKNWSPFINNNDKLCFIYGLSKNEHLVLEMNDIDEQYIENIHRTYCPLESEYKYLYGSIRGGTPAISYNEKYNITFSHCVKVHKFFWDIYIYTMGFYIFEKEAPYKVYALGSRPLLVPNTITTLIDRPSQQNLVIFPSGVVRNDDDNGYLVSFGYHDYINKIINILDKDIEDNVILNQ